MPAPVEDSLPQSWLLLIYRVPSESSRARVAVWRELKRLGVLYLQQAVCVLPDRPELRAELAGLRDRIATLAGTSMFFVLDNIEPLEQERLIDGFRSNSGKEYAEIIEECETRFAKEIEFERFRENYTFEESEEIRQDFEKLQRWLTKVQARDWVAAPGRDEAQAKVAECEQMLEKFEADVFERVGGES